MTDRAEAAPIEQRSIRVQPTQAASDAPIEVDVRDFSFFYGAFRALDHITMRVRRHQVTALIGPSGSGKSTLLRALNRMHDDLPGTRHEGQILLDGEDINAIDDLVTLRKRIGMIFQRPNPFPMSIFDNVAYGLRLKSQRVPTSEVEGRVEQALKDAALWDEVKDKIRQSGMALSGGQQQRLCIARAIAVKPAVLLMDEPCAALDPVSTMKIEQLMDDLKDRYTIVIVTHNLQQAGRTSDQTVFLSMNPETRAGFVVEAGPTYALFTNPRDQRTEDYISGRFG